MNRNEIVAELLSLRDEGYAAMQKKIIPNLEPDRIIGVRTPALRGLAKRIYGDNDAALFLAALPHQYFEENQLHAFVISLEKDIESSISEVEAFLPYIDNWATCDQLSPKAFKKQPEKLLPHIKTWMSSDKTYTVRFGIGMLMQYFLDDKFRAEYAEAVASVHPDEYYVNMMRAWYFATALAKQYDAVIPFIEEKRLDGWTHNKAIQKSIESYRIAPEQKAYLRTLKVAK